MRCVCTICKYQTHLELHFTSAKDVVIIEGFTVYIIPWINKGYIWYSNYPYSKLPGLIIIISKQTKMYRYFIYSDNIEWLHIYIRYFPILVATASFSHERGLPVNFCVDFNHFQSIIMSALVDSKTLKCSFLNNFRQLFHMLRTKI